MTIRFERLHEKTLYDKRRFTKISAAPSLQVGNVVIIKENDGILSYSLMNGIAQETQSFGQVLMMEVSRK